MKKYLLLIIMALTTCSTVMAQKKLSDVDLLKEIQLNEEYIYGVGQAETIDEASQKALGDLVSKITSNVESQYNYLLSSQQNNSDFTTKVDVQSVVSTYSRMTLNNAGQVIVPAKKKDKLQTVYRYITKRDLQDMYNKRGDKVRYYVNIARRAAKSGEPGRALQKYYWGLALLMSYPDGSLLEIDDDDFNRQYAYSWIPIKMKELLKKITINVDAVKEDRANDEMIVNLSVMYDGRPADDLLITFASTDSLCTWTETVTASNGHIPLYVPIDTKLRRLVAHINYAGREEAAVDPDLAAVIDVADFVHFKDEDVRIGRQIEDLRLQCSTPAAQPTVQPSQSAPAVQPSQTAPAYQPSQTTVASAPQSAPAVQESTANAHAPVAAVTTPVSNTKPKGNQPLYTYEGDKSGGLPDGEGVMRFNRAGVFDDVTVEEGDSLRGFFINGHIYIVSHYDSNGNLKRQNITKDM